MAYNKTTWKNGDTITAEKLNNLEEGVAGASSTGGGVFIVEVEKSSPPVGNTGSIYTLNKTWKEIYDALFEGGRIVICHESKDDITTDSIISSITIDDSNESYSVAFSQAVFGQELTTDSENGYPSTFMS